jgi:hypothetical protein
VEGQVGKTLIRIDPEIEIRKVACNNIKDVWPKVGQYVKKYNEKLENGDKNNDDGDDERERDDETENEIENN